MIKRLLGIEPVTGGDEYKERKTRDHKGPQGQAVPVGRHHGHRQVLDAAAAEHQPVVQGQQRRHGEQQDGPQAAELIDLWSRREPPR